MKFDEIAPIPNEIVSPAIDPDFPLSSPLSLWRTPVAGGWLLDIAINLYGTVLHTCTHIPDSEYGWHWSGREGQTALVQELPIAPPPIQGLPWSRIRITVPGGWVVVSVTGVGGPSQVSTIYLEDPDHVLWPCTDLSKKEVAHGLATAQPVET